MYERTLRSIRPGAWWRSFPAFLLFRRQWILDGDEWVRHVSSAVRPGTLILTLLRIAASFFSWIIMDKTFLPEHKKYERRGYVVLSLRY